MRRLVRVVPEPWRSRYGQEVEQVLASSEHRLRDTVDLMVWGVRLRMERRARSFVIVGTVLVAIGTVTVGWATGQLRDGILELPRHWWSTLAAVPAVAGIATLVVAALHRPRVEP